MSTPLNQMPSQMPTDIPSLQNMLKNAVSKIMALNQTVQELMTANISMRANFHAMATDKAALEAHLKTLAAPIQVPETASLKPVANGAVTDEHPSVKATSDADTVPA